MLAKGEALDSDCNGTIHPRAGESLRAVLDPSVSDDLLVPL